MHGKIMGKNAATLKDIESDYSVKIVMPNKNDVNDLGILIQGPTVQSVNFAKNRILDICGLSPSSKEIEKIQNDLKILKQKTDDLFTQANESPRGAKRDQLFNEANRLRDEYEKAGREAAETIFKIKNQGYGVNQMDLHGLFVEDAERFVLERLKKTREAIKNKVFALEIITGAGHHSENNTAKIKPAIEKILREQGFVFHEDETGGILIVNGITTQSPSIHYEGQHLQSSSKNKVSTGETDIFSYILDLFSCCLGGGRERF